MAGLRGGSAGSQGPSQEPSSAAPSSGGGAGDSAAEEAQQSDGREESAEWEGQGPELTELSAGTPAKPGRCRLDSEVLLRVEFISDSLARMLLYTYRATLAAGVALLGVFIWLKYVKPDKWWFNTNYLATLNVVLASVCLAALLACCALFLAGTFQARRQHRHWGNRRRRLVSAAAADTLAMTINNVAWLTSNAFFLSRECRDSQWRGVAVSFRFVVWSAWNVFVMYQLVQVTNLIPADALPRLGRLLLVLRPRAGALKRHEDALVLDLPWWHHLPKLLLYIPVQLLIFFDFLLGLGIMGGECHSVNFLPQPGVPCREWDVSCQPCTAGVVFATLKAAAFMVLLGMFCLYSWVALRQLRQRPYSELRVANVLLRFLLNTRLVGCAFFLVVIALLWFAQLDSCAAYAEAALGFSPMMIVGSCVSVTNALLFLPAVPRTKQVELHVWLQDFAWLERDMPRKVAQRPVRRQEPLFCFEIALKMLYWVYYAYLIGEKEVEEAYPGWCLETALGLLGLEAHEVVWERGLDNKCVIAWRPGVAVCAFRGTASKTNMLTDLKVWRMDHPPRRGSYFLRSRPLIHGGFGASWLESGLRERVLRRLWTVMSAGGQQQGQQQQQGGGQGQQQWTLYFTGHSLGGSLAQLAAYEAVQAVEAGSLGRPGAVSVHCYTYGAPRTGNHAFAKDYDRVVPDTWCIINDQDTVPRTGKFGWGWYKHAGHRVIINPMGDMVVRPSYLEMIVHHAFHTSYAQHMLGSYLDSFRAVMRAQFVRKGVSRAGQQALKELSQCRYVKDMLVQSLQLRTASLRRLNVSLRSSARPGSSRSCGSLDLEWPESGALPTRAATAAAAASSTKQLQEDGEGDAGCGGLEHGEASQAQLGLLDSGSPGPLVVL